MEAVAQNNFMLTGSWVGVYQLSDQPVVFFVEWDEGENGRFQLNHAPRSQPIEYLNQTATNLQFSTDSLAFEGDWIDEAFVGYVDADGENGRFYLTPIAPITTDTFDTIIGSYDIESEAPILLSRADKITQLFSQQGNQQIRLYPTGQSRFLTASGELITVQPEQIQIKNALAPESSGIQRGNRTHTYQEKAVTFKNGDVSISGSLFLPAGEGTFPAIILLHGSGAAEQHFYRIFADLFARNGIAALIYDKRGHGATTGQPEDTTLQNLATDARTGIQFLAQHDRIDAEQIGIWGFSQGGRILPMVAAKNDDVAFVIAVSAPGMSTNTLDLWRQDQKQQEVGTSKLKRFLTLKMSQFSWRDSSEDKNINPTTYWRQNQQPTLLIYGSKDSVVPPDDSAEAILTALEQAGNTAVFLSLTPTANHDIMLTETAVPTFDPDYFNTMISWIQNGFPTQSIRPTLQPTGEFTGNGRYAPNQWYGQIWFQLLLVLLIGAAIMVAAVFIFRGYHRNQTINCR